VYNAFMFLQAFCPTCQKSVAIETTLSVAEWKAKTGAGESLEIMHTTPSGDHRWFVGKAEGERLLKHLKNT
jgi:hypothetical protein